MLTLKHTLTPSGPNAAGNEVTGTASGGFEEFVAAEGELLLLASY